jgi:hypothetical protein
MKKVILALSLITFSAFTFADNLSSSSDSVSLAGAASGSSLKLDQSSHNSGNVAAADLSSMVPAVSAPNLATTLTETCMGSTSFGASGSGFGFSFGTTWRDSACVRRLDARQMSAFNETAISIEMMCDSDLVREAAKRANRPCVADGGTPRVYAQAVQVQVQEIPSVEAAAPVVKEEVRE